MKGFSINLSRSRTSLLTSAFMSAASLAQAANYQWDPNGNASGLGGTGTWDTTSLFWDLIGTAPDDGTEATAAYTFTNVDKAIFGVTAGTVTLGTGVTLNSIQIDTAGYVITGNTITLSGTTPTITANANASISSALAGSAGLVKTGTGNLTISGNNTFTGGTTVSAGTLTLARSAGFGGTTGSISTGALTINSGATATSSTVFAISGDTSASNTRVVNVSGTLNLSASEYIKTYNLTGGTINAPTAAGEFLRASTAGLFINSLASATTSTINNKIDLTFASATIDTAEGAAANDLTITGVISQNSGAGSGAKSISKSGAGTLLLRNTANAYAGGTTITGGELQSNIANSFGTGTYTPFGTGAVTAGTGTTLRFKIQGSSTSNYTIANAINLNSANLIYEDGNHILTGNVAITGSNSISGVWSGKTLTMSGIVSGAGSITHGGFSTLTLSGINSYTGNTSVTGGNLIIGGAGQLGSGSYAGTIALSSGTVFNHASSATQTLSGVISGAGVLSKTGSGTLTLSGANSYSGGTTFNSGMIRVSTSNTALGTGTLTVTTPTTNASTTNLLATASGGGARTLANNVVITNNGTGTTTLQLDAGFANLFLAGNISGNGGISTTSSGRAALTGTNTYTGSTVLAGTNTLVLSGSNTTSGITVGTGTTLALRSISLSSTQNITGAGNVTKDISFFGASTINGNNNTYTGSTTVNIDRFTVGSTGVINGTSGIAVQAQWGANFNNLGSVTTAGAITVAGTGNLTSGGVTADSSFFRNSGTINAGSMTLNSSSSANTTANRGGTYSQSAGSTTLSGALTLASNGGTGAAGTAGNDAAFNLSGGSFTADSIAVNAGTLNATAGTLTASTITVGSGAVFNAAGTAVVTGGVTMSSGSTLTGNGGLFNASVTINGIHAPGSSPGLQTFASGLTYGSTSTLNAELVGDTLGIRGTNYDAIDVTGGNLTIDLSSVFKLIGSSIDYTVSLWDSDRAFTIIDFTSAGTSAGIFSLDTSAAGSFAGEGSWALSNTSGDVVLTWTAVPEPAAALLGGMGMLLLLRRRR